MPPNIALLFGRPLERVVRLPHDGPTVSCGNAGVKTKRCRLHCVERSWSAQVQSPVSQAAMPAANTTEQNRGTRAEAWTSQTARPTARACAAAWHFMVALALRAHAASTLTG
jgi:hypothetical protein